MTLFSVGVDEGDKTDSAIEGNDVDEDEEEEDDEEESSEEESDEELGINQEDSDYAFKDCVKVYMGA